jgi:hypothetical protein
MGLFVASEQGKSGALQLVADPQPTCIAVYCCHQTQL